MKATINGRVEEFERENISVTSYLHSKHIQPETVAIELNMHIIKKSQYSETMIREGDEVEIVRFVGGGAW